MSTSLAEQERLLLQAAQDHYALNLSTAASIAWLVYDIILTLPQEFELVWRSKFTVHKALYVVTRYFGLACLIVTLIGDSSDTLSLPVCRRWLWFIGLGPSISNATGELLFMTRIYAAYGRTRRIFVTLLLLWLAEGIVGWVATTLNIKATMMIQRPLGYPLPGCTEDQTPIGFVHLDFVSWAVSSAVAVCLSTLILVYFFRSLNFHMSIRTSQGLKLSELKKLAPVMVLFVRDGMSYFLLILSCDLICLFMTCVLADRSISEIGFSWLLASYAIASSRLYLNLRGSVVDNDHTLTVRSDDADLEFRPHTTQFPATVMSNSYGVADT